MERELWRKVYQLVGSLSRSRRRTRVRIADRVIVLVHLWAALHDRGMNWACDVRNWGRFKPRRLPSESTMSRRLRSGSVQALLNAIETQLRSGPQEGFAPGGLVKIVDGKPLPVGGHSHAPDAKNGRGAGGMAKGYKWYVIWGDGPLPCVSAVRPMNESEPVVAAELVKSLPGAGYLLGDAAYDTNPLHDAVAAAGHQLVAPRKRPRAGLGHRRHSPHRLRSIEMLEGDFGRSLHRMRDRIERRFARLTNFAGGLGPLPNWVRRLPRVERWVQAKLILHGLRILPQGAS
jgi:Transposase DDE domain